MKLTKMLNSAKMVEEWEGVDYGTSNFHYAGSVNGINFKLGVKKLNFVSGEMGRNGIVDMTCFIKAKIGSDESEIVSKAFNSLYNYAYENFYGKGSNLIKF